MAGGSAIAARNITNKYRTTIGLLRVKSGGIPPVRDGSCVTNTSPEKEVWSCTGDEGRPLEAGIQVQVSNHRKLLRSKAVVVSVAEKLGQDPSRYDDPERRAKANRR